MFFARCATLRVVICCSVKMFVDIYLSFVAIVRLKCEKTRKVLFFWWKHTRSSRYVHMVKDNIDEICKCLSSKNCIDGVFSL